jgi:hypothetical protein
MHAGITFFKALHGKISEVVVGAGKAGGDFKFRQEFGQILNVNFGYVRSTAFRNFYRISDGFGVSGKEGGHLVSAFKIELVAKILFFPVFVVSELGGTYTEQYIMGYGVFLLKVVYIVGGNQGNAGTPGNAGYHFVYFPLGEGTLQYVRRDSVILNFQVEITLPEKILVEPGFILCLRRFALSYKPGNLPGNAGGKGYQALVVLLQQLVIDPGPGIEAFGIGTGTKLNQIEITLSAGGQKDKMKVFGFILDVLSVKPGIGSHINLAADNRMDGIFSFYETFYGLSVFLDGYFGFFAGCQEVHDPEHIAVVR